MKKYLPSLIIALGLLTFYYFRYQVAPNLEFEELVLITETGDVTKVSSEIGDRSVLHFYASWCGPCLKEMRAISANELMLKSLGLTFICITDDTEDQVKRMKETMPADMKFFRIKSLKDAGIFTLPTTYMLKEQNIVTKQVEAFDWSNKNKIENIYK